MSCGSGATSTTARVAAPVAVAGLLSVCCCLPHCAYAYHDLSLLPLPLLCRDPWPAIQSLPVFLAGFEGPQAPPTAVSGLAVHWIIFGSSGHEMRPGGGVLRNYHRCLQLRHAQHALGKTIVRTA